MRLGAHIDPIYVFSSTEKSNANHNQAEVNWRRLERLPLTK
jgi:hypothetical protein